MTMETCGWRLSGELTREQSEQLENAVELVADVQGIFPPTCSRFEQDGTPLWQVDIYFPEEADTNFINSVLDTAELNGWQYTFAQVENRDWVSESQKLLAPVRAGRFLIFGSHDADKRDPNAVNLQIDAGQAFGTGKHETTAACLQLIDSYAKTVTLKNILDIGTGTGVLALAAYHVWPQAQITATDIDPVAIDVSRENLMVNDVEERTNCGTQNGIALFVADGMHDDALVKRAPFDLIIANILAGPLIDMAVDITGALAPSGTLILSGLLITQKEDVIAAYAKNGLHCTNNVEIGDWAALHMHHK